MLLMQLDDARMAAGDQMSIHGAEMLGNQAYTLISLRICTH